MGQFSWLDCETGNQIVNDRHKNVYLLVPRAFGGGHIVEPCYNGYGDFGEYDVYDLVATWNRDHIDASVLKPPARPDYFYEEHYRNAVKRHKKECKRLTDFQSHKPADYMVSHYGEDYLRLIGIDIACYDEDNARLKYPIKITYNPTAVYEDCEPSPSDPNQGWA